MESPSKDGKSAASVARWAAVAIVLLALLGGSLLPGGMSVMPDRISFGGGIMLFPGAISPPMKHLLVFGLLGFFLVLALEADWRRAALVAGGLAILGLVIELVQLAIPERSFLWLDAGASAAGAVGGVLMGVFVRWFVGGGEERG